MPEKNNWKLGQIRSAAKLAVELGVSIELKADGSIVVAPSAGDPKKPMSALEKWKAEQEELKAQNPEVLPGLNQRETSALKQLVNHGGKLAANRLSHCGPATLRGLSERGAIELKPLEKGGDRPVIVHLTALGRKAWESIR
ncbi:hypothetical protein GFB56_12500 [Ensifer sp. T173]|uniref:HTH marR-type domain-containing protein n=1 Tax=Ensifer canadensis TaxID=555315 RepID=A0AAW4FLA3_9HYPH|nr:hypothetical protein [Ensifer canadensis]MBM3091633.1 hypothetical protein [Ensifer canadensis]UBI74379.1 hypothetical protein J3R84_12850 [Ensifer canadensis]